MKNLSLYIMAVFLTMALTIPVFVFAEPPLNTPPDGPLGDIQEQIDAEEAARIAGDATEHQHHIDGDAAEAAAR